MRWDEDETRHDQGRVDRWLALAGLAMMATVAGAVAWFKVFR